MLSLNGFPRFLTFCHSASLKSEKEIGVHVQGDNISPGWMPACAAGGVTITLVYHIREAVGGKTDAVCQKTLHQSLQGYKRGGFRAVADNAAHKASAIWLNISRHNVQRNAVGRKDITVPENLRIWPFR